MAEWYYSSGEQRLGPISSEQIKGLAASGQLNPSDLVWHDGMADWLPASDAGIPFPQKPSAAKAAAEKTKAAVETAQRIGQALNQNATVEKHFLDVIVRFFKTTITDSHIATLQVALFRSGYVCLFAAMAVSIASGAIVGVKTDHLSPIFYGIGVAAILAVAQFTAKKIQHSLESLVKSTPTKLLPEFPDCFALFCVAWAALILTGGFLVSARSEEIQLLLSSCIFCLILLVVATISLHPQTINVNLMTGATAGLEALGVMSFLLKILVRLIQTCFGIGVTLGTLVGVYAAALYVMGGFENKLKASAYGIAAAYTVLVAGLAPLAGYLVFIFYYLSIDVLSAILVVPRKLDRLTMSVEARQQKPASRNETV